MDITICLNFVRSRLVKLINCIIFSVVLCLCATEVAQAKTIANDYNLIDDSRLSYFKNIYLRSPYKNYLLGTEVVNSGYNSITYYYLCLTDSDIDLKDVSNASSSCDSLFRYTRNGSSYVLESINDKTLSFVNSIYYTSNSSDKDLSVSSYLFIICVFLAFLIFSLIMIKLFGG